MWEAGTSEVMLYSGCPMYHCGLCYLCLSNGNLSPKHNCDADKFRKMISEDVHGRESEKLPEDGQWTYQQKHSINKELKKLN